MTSNPTSSFICKIYNNTICLRESLYNVDIKRVIKEVDANNVKYKTIIKLAKLNIYLKPSKVVNKILFESENLDFLENRHISCPKNTKHLTYKQSVFFIRRKKINDNLSRHELINILKDDLSNRNKQGILFKVDKLIPCKKILTGLPVTKFYRDSYIPVNEIELNNEVFDFPFNDFPEGLILAGGCFFNPSHDYDVFIYKNHEAIFDKFCELGTMKVRRPYCVDFELGYFEKVQVILKKYSTISEILYGFDLGSSQIGYDGKTFYLTILSKFALKTNFNILDTTKRSKTYEHRIDKYIAKGFETLLPFSKDDMYIDYMISDSYGSCETSHNLINLAYSKGLTENFNINYPPIYYPLYGSLVSKIYWLTKMGADIDSLDTRKCQCEIFNKLMKEYKQIDPPITWQINESDTELTPWLHPIYKSDSEWYKEHYYPPWTLKNAEWRNEEVFISLFVYLKDDLILDLICKIIEMYDALSY
jgi:hypothetical protein